MPVYKMSAVVRRRTSRHGMADRAESRLHVPVYGAEISLIQIGSDGSAAK